MTWAIFAKAANAALDIKAVQYALVVAVIALLVLALVYRGRLEVCSLQLSAAKGDKAEYAAYLLNQNAAIKKQGDAMQALLEKLQKANAEAAKVREQMKKRQQELGQIILKGDCPDMVQQVLDEVRK